MKQILVSHPVTGHVEYLVSIQTLPSPSRHRHNICSRDNMLFVYRSPIRRVSDNIRLTNKCSYSIK